MAVKIGVDGAQRIAAKWAPEDAQVVLAGARELELGWYFPIRFAGVAPGCNGVVVNKGDGSIFALGSAFPVERDLRFYDRGLQSAKVDLVIHEVHDQARTIDTLLEVGPERIELSYESGTVWRLPKPLTAEEVRVRLETLPSIFADLSVYFRFEALAKAQDEGFFSFELLKRPD